ncbi:Uncharacterized protein dnm_008300 [Desulfonema magnum]|uniref:Uncharacterized protein n=1 Tax=Desulfonema magnum TaxID=45655 RepID=A0A975BFK5_9BACT|nr:Uncharacterized protein dnm_008300 [Desulfonema magnum]
MQKLYFCACEKAFFALRRKYRKTRLHLNQQYCPPGPVRALSAIPKIRYNQKNNCYYNPNVVYFCCLVKIDFMSFIFLYYLILK